MATDTRHYPPGSLVRARDRDWVVVPSDEEDVVRLRPVDGFDEDAVGVYLPLEPNTIQPSDYPAPNPESSGDFTGALLLRDATRLTLRSGAGPFRSIGKLSVIPRPYQYVPLIMSLRLHPVRLLIADDVGVGKTIEAAMIARELLDRGLVRRIAVVCVPHLCDQWEEELRDKFNISSAVIQPSRIARLERELPRGDLSIYQYYRHLVVSIDHIKSERNRRPFLDNAPDLIIVDEAHTAARPRGDRGGQQQQRYDFLRELMKSPERHLILTTATPHGGIEESFRSLLGLLDPSFDIPQEDNLARARLTPHLVQRRRADIENWLGATTPFPERDPVEHTYRMTSEYLNLFENVLTYCRESVSSGEGLRQQQQRVRYWAAIAILRCVLSSPAAAEAMLEKRSAKVEGLVMSGDSDADEVFSSQILDSSEEDEPADYLPTAPLDDPSADLSANELRRLDGFLQAAQKLRGLELDAKLSRTKEIVSELLRDGFSPIVYCRFIATAEYVAQQLQNLLQRDHPGVRVTSVTGGDGDSEVRTEKVDQLAQEPVRVLVATDCLSEGINLQEHFNAVLHYDLPWNPNRLEQREGRVDRYGQPKTTVRTVLLYGSDNPIDLVVLNVLVRKAHTIRQRLGVAVPVPVDSDQVVQAVVDSVLLRQRGQGQQLQLALEDPKVSAFHEEWDRATEREGRTRAYFAQRAIKPDEVARELEEMEPALGNARDVQQFVANGLQRFGGELKETRRKSTFQLEPGELKTQMELRTGLNFPLQVAFDGVPSDGVLLMGRNHPIVETLSNAVLGRALSGTDQQFSRCGAIFTDAVSVRTAVVVLRLRYLLEKATQQFAEEVVLAAFQRVDGGIQWLEPLDKEGLRLVSEARVTANMPASDRKGHVEWALGMLQGDRFQGILDERVSVLEQSHARLRTMVRAKPLKVIPHRPPDILGCYVLVPAGGSR